MRFINDNLYPLFGALVLFIAASCWFALPEPSTPKAVPLVAEPWVLPKLVPRDIPKALQAITTRNLWGVAAAGAAAAAPPAPKWNVLGIARNGGDRFVLLAYEGKPVEILKTGDALPDGLKIVQIEDDRFFVMTADKKKLAFGIYKNDPTK